MKYLNELAKIVTRKKVAHLEVLDDNILNGDSLFSRFYEGLAAGAFKTDEDAAQLFYGTSPNDDRYRKLKSRMRKRLLNHLFYLDVNESTYSDYHTANYNCNKNLILSKILLTHGAKTTFEKISKQIISQGTKYDLTDALVPASRHLMYHYAFTGDKNKFDKYKQLLEQQTDLLQQELEIVSLASEVIVHFAKGAPKDQSIIDLAIQNQKKAEEIASQYKSYTVKYYYFYLSCIVFITLNNPRKVIELSDQAEEYFHENPQFYQESVLAQFSLFKMNAYLQIRDFEKGHQSAEKCVQYFKVGTNNWLIFMEYYFLLAMYTKNYVSAAKIYNDVTSHERFQQLPALKKEKWKIFEAYLNFIFDYQQLDKSLLQDDDARNFKIYKFLNEVPTFSKDKSGYNVAILALQFLWQLKENDYQKLFDKADALRVYSQRYLRKQDNERPYLFIKMIMLAERKTYDYEDTLEASRELYEQLNSTNESQEVAEWEILPYDIMWEIVLEIMQKQH